MLQLLQLNITESGRTIYEKRGLEATQNKLFGVNMGRGYKFPSLIGA